MPSLDKKPIHSPAIGAKIESLRYDAEAGYVVIELYSGENLWISADWCGYHVLHSPTSRVAAVGVEALESRS